MAEAGVLTGYDTEADVIPPPHDELILADRRLPRRRRLRRAGGPPDLGPPGGRGGGRGARRPSDGGELLHRRVPPRRPPLRLPGRLPPRLVRLVERDLALNHALRESGRPERFHPLDSDGQDTSLLLLTPEAASVAREELFLPVGEAPEASPAEAAAGPGTRRQTRRRPGLSRRRRRRPVGRSIAAGVDDLAAGHGGERPPGAEVDAVLDELDRAVEEADVHAARVVRLAPTMVLSTSLLGLAFAVAEEARQLVRGHDVAVAAAGAVGLVRSRRPPCVRTCSASAVVQVWL